MHAFTQANEWGATPYCELQKGISVLMEQWYSKIF